ncbi:hypothetical protein SNEBB_001633 [Seison nebaliae]|nr:hypothetical protein SNEBB_001633 [Seison nebaliae]
MEAINSSFNESVITVLKFALSKFRDSSSDNITLNRIERKMFYEVESSIVQFKEYFEKPNDDDFISTVIDEVNEKISDESHHVSEEFEIDFEENQKDDEDDYEEEPEDEDYNVLDDNDNVTNRLTDNKENDISLDYKRKIVEFWRSTKNKRRRSISCMSSKYRCVKNISQLQKFEKDIANNSLSGKRYRFKEIQAELFKEFIRRRSSLIPLKDIDLQQMATQVSNKEELPLFKASTTFITNFKKNYNNGSRKITKFLSKKDLTNENDLISTAKTFSFSIKTDIELNKIERQHLFDRLI